MDHILLSHPPLPAVGTDDDLLELDVLWPAAPSAVHSTLFGQKKGRSNRSATIFCFGEAKGPRRKIAETTWPRPYNKAQSTRSIAAPASPSLADVACPSFAHTHPTSTSHAGEPPHHRRSAVLVIHGAGADAMDRLLLSLPPLPTAGADGDLLELDVLWPTAPSAVHSP
jgi:hypothetical protein